jgi:hypothetical protein
VQAGRGAGLGYGLFNEATAFSGRIEEVKTLHGVGRTAGIRKTLICSPKRTQKAHQMTSSGGEYSRGSLSLTHQDYKIGIVCVLEKELLLDETDPALLVDKNDSNCYALGRMNGHNMVAACLPLGVYGTNMASTVASNMKRSFRYLK